VNGKVVTLKVNHMGNITWGQIAFEAYSKAMGGKTYDGKAIPWWSDLSEEVQAGWEAAAKAVARNTDWMKPKR
jgi:hypothetical protein